jgi:NAD(P)-dependent dehydrogenase (short-subunit alcohol dehydrogenase family)
LPADPRGRPVAYRRGEWFRQRLLACELPEQHERSMYKVGGVYVLIGGAGGIGEVLSEYLVRHYRARVIWIGRRECDAAIAAKLGRLGELGAAPEYFSADACDREALERVYRQIKATHGAIHGLVHTAIVLSDKSLARMPESVFKQVLAAKVDVSVRLAQVFAQEQLDFVLFFSSLQSFIAAPGQSNYAAGCAFKDAFAHQLGLAWRAPVRVMNWGYWGNVGAVAADEYRARMAQIGLVSIEPHEGMAAVEKLLAGPLTQWGMVKKLSSTVIEEFQQNACLMAHSASIPSVFERLAVTVSAKTALAEVVASEQ